MSTRPGILLTIAFAGIAGCAAIRVDGRLWFTSNTHQPVLTRGAGNAVDILLKRVP